MRDTRPFARLLSAYAISRSGDYLYNVSLLVHVYAVTRSATCVAVTSAVRLVPAVVLAPWAGVLVDRCDRVRVLVGSWLLAALVMAGLAASVAGGLPVAVTVVGAALGVVVSSPAGPAVSTLVVQTVPEDGRTRANSALSLVEYAAVVAGPAGAAVAVLLGPAWMPFALNAGTYVIAAGLLHALAAPRAVRGERASSTAAVRDGAARQARAGLTAALAPPVARVLAGIVLSSVLFGAQVVLVVPVSSRLLGTGAWGAGVLEASAGAGGVIVALLTARWAGWTGHRHALPVAVAVNGASLAALSCLHTPLWAWACLAGAGATTLVVDVAGLTRLQALVPSALLGRVEGLASSSAVAGMLLGNLLAGTLVVVVGVRLAVVLTALPVVVAGLLLATPTGWAAPTADRRVRASRSRAGRGRGGTPSSYRPAPVAVTSA